MRFKLAARFLLFSVLCAPLTSVDVLLKEGFGAQNSRIVFSTARHHRTEIYIMDADGGNQERLTDNRAYDDQPTWSPDRENIAFVSDRNGGVRQIYVMDARGKRAIKLTDTAEEKGDPDWSPDGERIAFTSWDGQDWWSRENPRISVMDADGKNAFKLTDGEHPSWSPDGRRIAFTSGYDRDDHIYVIDANGGRRKRVTKSRAVKSMPAWSPDGKRIAYMATDDGTLHIFVIGADGKNRVRLTHNPEHHMDPTWSPDGRLIAYVWGPDILLNPPAKIRLMTADGNYIKQLSGEHNGNEYYPDFGPVSLAVSPASNKAITWGKLKKRAPNLR